MQNWKRSGLKVCVLLCFAAARGEHLPSQADVFVSGTDGYHTYRIPAIVVTKSGALLAFCEGRKNSRADTGDIDVLCKRSTNGGKSWSRQKVLWDEATNTCGNPCAVVDENSGKVWLLLTHNLGGDKESALSAHKARGARTVWVCHSDDDGVTWSKPAEITNNVKDPSWGWFATGPGVGIQIQHGSHKGRLIIPCDHSYQTGVSNEVVRGANAVFSDDGGQHWKPGGTIRPKMNECQVVELADGNGSLLMNMRSYFGRGRRAQSVSHDGGMSWSEPQDAPQLVEPVCQASILRFTWPSDQDKSRILFSNPADEKRRVNLTVRLSFDEAETWPISKSLHAGPAAYSCLVALPDAIIGCLYECGETNASERITFARFSLAWLTDGKDSVGQERASKPSRP